MEQSRWTMASSIRIALVLLTAFAAVPGVRAGGSYTWTNTTASTEYWNTAGNWKPSTNTPGAGGGDAAYLTNSASGAYTVVLNATPANGLATLQISNALGQAWLLVTNATLTVTTNSLASGGRLQIDNGGVVTGITTFAWTGTNGLINLDAGGQLFTTVAIALNCTGQVSSLSAPGQGGVWNLNAKDMTVGSAGISNAFAVNNATLTNVNNLNVGSGANYGHSLTVTNGGAIFANNRVYVGNACYGNSVVVDNSTLAGGGEFDIGYKGSNNTLRIVNGGYLANNGMLVVGGSTAYEANYNYNTVFVGGTNASGAKATVNLANAGLGVGGGTGAKGPFSNCWATIDNGGVVTNAGAVGIGYLQGSGNGLTITNGGAFYSGAVSIGHTLASNQYVVGGGVNPVTVVNNGTIIIGRSVNSSSNTMTVTNANLWSGGLTVGGSGGAGNQLNVFGNTTWTLIAAGGVTVGNGSPSSKMVVDGGGVAYGAVLTNVNGLTLGSGAAGNGSILTIANGGVFLATNRITIGNPSSANTLTIDNGTLTGIGEANIGYGGNNNTVNVLNGGYLSNIGGVFYLGGNSQGSTGYASNTLFVAGANAAGVKATANLGGSTLYIGPSFGGPSTNNWVTIGNGGVVTNVGSAYIGAIGGINCGLAVTNGGAFYSGTVYLGGGTAVPGSNDLYLVGGGVNPVTVSNGAINIGTTFGGSFNTMTVTNATLFSGALVVGGASGYLSNRNMVNVQAGAYWNLQGGSATAGGNSSISNVVFVFGGGIFESGGLITGAGVGNVISNSGGVYQFATPTPTITTNGGTGTIALDNGVISFRGIGNASVKDNWTNTLRSMTFSGANAFRLNNATNNSATSQTYWFDTIPAAPTNYAGLEMFNGGTAYTNGSVTIGTNGWLTFKNTTATMWGAVTNYGKMQVYNSTVTFKTNLFLAAGGTVIWTTNAAITVAGTVTLPASMVFSNSSAMNRNDTLTLFTANGGFAGASPGSWTVYPSDHRVSINGNSLSLAPIVTGTTVFFR